MAAAQTKEFLTLKELAKFLKKGESTCLRWVNEGRITAVEKPANIGKIIGRKRKPKTHYRVALTEAKRVKRELDRGMWA